MFKIIELKQSDDYLAADKRQLTFEPQSGDTWPDLTGATIELRFASVAAGVFTHLLNVAGTVISSSQVDVDLTATQAAALYTGGNPAPGSSASLQLQLIATLADTSKATLASGICNVAPSLPSA